VAEVPPHHAVCAQPLFSSYDAIDSPKRQRKAALAARGEETGSQGDALRIWREVLGDCFLLS
jgi:hypothetical protein